MSLECSVLCEWTLRNQRLFSDGWRKARQPSRLRHMNARMDHLMAEALSLTPDERSAIALALLESLDGEDEATVSQAWADEIEQRKHDLQRGVRQPIPWEQVKARLGSL